MDTRVNSRVGRWTMTAAALLGLLAARSAGAAMICTNGPSFALQTAAGYMQTPDGNTIYMWSYADASAGGGFQLPSPILCVTQGELVSVTLTNYLAEPVSIVFPGQVGVQTSGGAPGLFTAEAPACAGGPPCAPGVVTYSFIAAEPGTYLYESGSAPHKQVQMGLYGALVVRPALGPNFAYNDPDTEFNPEREYLLLLHDIDPVLHQAVERGRPYDVGGLKARYWTINGRSFPDTVLDNFDPMLPFQPYGALVTVEPTDPLLNPLPALVRYANAGMFNHPFHPHGNHTLVIGRDGRRLAAGGEDLSWQSFTTTAGAGQTFDFFARWYDAEGWSSRTNPIPTDVPQLQNLVFMNDMTRYSGSPYLGETGELPAGVASHNSCGEYYMVWHSHALPEIQNFDEGMGGLTTLWRIDPPGGCPGN